MDPVCELTNASPCLCCSQNIITNVAPGLSLKLTSCDVIALWLSVLYTGLSLKYGSEKQDIICNNFLILLNCVFNYTFLYLKMFFQLNIVAVRHQTNQVQDCENS